MRSDIGLYVLGVICFIIAIYAYVSRLVGETALYIYTPIVLGIVFIGLGFVARPRKAAVSPTIPAPPSQTPIPPETSKDKPQQQKAEQKQSEKTPRRKTRTRKTTRRRRAKKT